MEQWGCGSRWAQKPTRGLWDENKGGQSVVTVPEKKRGGGEEEEKEREKEKEERERERKGPS